MFASATIMEISAISVSKAIPSTFYSSFSDQSHLQYYEHGSSSFLNPFKLRFKMPSCRPSASKPVMAPVRAFCNSPSVAAMELTAEESLMKELADLKLQMKQKKKELKARMKEDKQKLKAQMKEEKKRKKQRDPQEGKTKTKCQSESSSSSSESCDEECSSVSIKTLRQSQTTIEDARANVDGGSILGNCTASCRAVSASSVSASFMDVTVGNCDGFRPSFSSLSSDASEACLEKIYMVSPDGGKSELCLTVASMGSSFNGCTSGADGTSELENVQRRAMKIGDLSPCVSRVDGRSGAISDARASLRVSNRIEVCAGGKCKKAGSEQLLLALQGQIPGSANLEAVRCKCMGLCSAAINVRVLKEDTNPQQHSHVDVEDGSLILSHHFGLGCPSVGLPSLSPKEGIRVPLPLAIV